MTKSHPKIIFSSQRRGGCQENSGGFHFLCASGVSFRIASRLVLLVMALTMMTDCAQQSQIKTHQVDDLTVSFFTEPHPARVGSNVFKAKVTDGRGNPMTDGRVHFMYSIPPKRRGKGKPEGVIAGIEAALTEKKEFRAPVNLEVDGEWQVVVKILHPDKPPVSATFKLEVR